MRIREKQFIIKRIRIRDTKRWQVLTSICINKLFSITSLICSFLLFFNFSFAQNPGFEESSSSGWTFETGSTTWTNTTSSGYYRSGSRGLALVSSTDNAKYANHNTNYSISIPATGTNYVHVIGYARYVTGGESGLDQGRVRALGTSTISGTLINLGTSFTRLTASGSATNGGTYYPSFQIDPAGSMPSGGTYAMDDIIIYTSPSSGVDITVPNAASNLGAYVSGTNVVLNWNDGTDNATNTSGIEGVLILRIAGDKTASIPSTLPQVYYSTSSSIGPITIVNGSDTWTVISNGTASGTYTDASPAANTYTYAVYMRDKAYNYSSGVGVLIDYCGEPTLQPSNAYFSSVSSTGYTVNWTNGNGNNRLVVMKEGSSVDVDPADGISYTANSSFGSGTDIGGGNYVVYAGNGQYVSVTNLAAGTNYFVNIYENNSSGSCLDYYVLSPVSTSQSTSSGEIGGLDGGFEDQSANPAANSSAYSTSNNPTDWTKNGLATASLTTSSGRSGPNYLTIGASGSDQFLRSAPVTTTVKQNVVYTYQFYYKNTGSTDNLQAYLQPDGSTTLGTGTSVGSLSNSNWTKVYGTVTSKNVAPSAYGHLVFKFSGSSGNNINIDDIAVYEGNSVDNSAPNAPTDPIVDVETYQSLYVTWTEASGGIDGGGYLVVRGTSDPSTAPNVNGIYKTGNAIGTGTIVYIGDATNFTDNSLTRNTSYFYRIYAYDKAYNYSAAATTSGTTRDLSGNAFDGDRRFDAGNSNCTCHSSGMSDTQDPDCWDRWNGSSWVDNGGIPTSSYNAYIENNDHVEGHGFVCNDLVISGTGWIKVCNIQAESFTINGDFESSNYVDIVTSDNDYGHGVTHYHTWTVNGNFKNYGSFTTGRDRNGSSSSTYDGQVMAITLGGSTDATFPGPGILNLKYDLVINKTNASNTVTLDNNVTIKDFYYPSSYTSTLTTSEDLKGKLTLTKGKLIIGDYDMRLQQYETINHNASSSTDSYVVTNSTNNATAGYLILQNRNTVTDYVFPIGPTTTSYNPVTISMTDASPGDTLFARVETTVSSADGVTNPDYFVDRIWFLEEGTVNGNGYNATFQWNVSDENLSFARASSDVYHNHGSGYNVQTADACSGSGPYTKMATGITTFSRWVIGSRQPLPIELTVFNAQCVNDKALLKWTTSSETNNDYFTIEKSKDLSLWENVGTIEGAGNSNDLRNYSLSDDYYDGPTYYRLSQTDFDGQKVSFAPVIVNCGDIYSQGVEISYNTELETFTYNITSSEQDTFRIFLINTFGQVVAEKSFSVEKGSSLLSWDVPAIAYGIYINQISNRNGTVIKSTQVFVK